MTRSCSPLGIKKQGTYIDVSTLGIITKNVIYFADVHRVHAPVSLGTGRCYTSLSDNPSSLFELIYTLHKSVSFVAESLRILHSAL